MPTIAYSRRNSFWFGTEERMGWFPTPNRGAATGATGWESGGSLLNGGGWQQGSFGSARNYIFEWPGSSSRQVSQLMKSYADGSYGRGLIYFLDPLIYDQNILPAMWADPSMGIGYEGASLVYGLTPTASPTTSPEVNDLPMYSATYDLTGVADGWRGKQDAVFLPLPESHFMVLGCNYSATGTGRVMFRTQSTNGALGTVTQMTRLPPGGGSVANHIVAGAGQAGVWVWVGVTAAGSSSVTLSAMTARITGNPLEIVNLTLGPWVGGQGHSGCRFIGKPTEIKNTGVDGGQVGFAASFREVGSWLYG